MHVESIKNAIFSLHELEPDAWNEFKISLKQRTLRKGDILWSIGEVCQHVVFMNMGDYYSFVSKNPCTLAYEALEDCELLTISRSDVYRLYDEYKSFERFGRILAERNFMGGESRN